MRSHVIAHNQTACTRTLMIYVRCAATAQVAGQSYTVGASQRAFTINGAPTLLLGGAIHPPRIAVSDWAPVLARARSDGLNLVQIYTMWNFHERLPGKCVTLQCGCFVASDILCFSCAAHSCARVRLKMQCIECRCLG
jgi:hypothetical protein